MEAIAALPHELQIEAVEDDLAPPPLHRHVVTLTPPTDESNVTM
jgi:hypothetical protein